MLSIKKNKTKIIIYVLSKNKMCSDLGETGKSLDDFTPRRFVLEGKFLIYTFTSPFCTLIFSQFKRYIILYKLNPCVGRVRRVLKPLFYSLLPFMIQFAREFQITRAFFSDFSVVLHNNRHTHTHTGVIPTNC